ncbi:glutamate-cysteine ligase family protein [Actinoplanes derwentensis]|uniref:Glutamate--cysteine ligase EgtA n=1 Tax=Actinoplanes derwentensis TaxID=113562 RepID=A0A1H2DAJ5_9ACTN|nr:glutamate-cysteine ligase family protein [Actinoplanes derwentensis]GID81757.1 glutamate--cysteine ligase EgtA [Actinoplanes derwentensis]SDT79775.1 glutamate--cysteine ligase [Actinoplanes derwentensis]
MGSADQVLQRADDAIEHIRGICFKTGPPRQVGAELEWTTHRTADPTAYLRPGELVEALGAHAPATLGNPNPVPLPGGGAVTVEPGGQVEISSAPAGSLTALHAAVTADETALTDLLGRAGLSLGERGLDPHREPRRILDTPRYAAMERIFNPAGRTMMGGTAGFQICLDAGEAAQIPARWAALHEIGPAMLALFANSPRDGWASARMAAWYGIETHRTDPVPQTADPALSWAEYAVDAPLLCIRRPDGNWDAPRGMTFRQWIDEGVPTLDDLDYHLGTLFPPVRPRGYLEVRYLDTQPAGEWIAPAALIVTVFADDVLTDRARDLAASAAGRWHTAARLGLADHPVREAATALADLALRNLHRTGLPAPVRDTVTDIVTSRLHHAASGRGLGIPA